MIRPREMMRRWFTQGARSTRPSVVLDLECLESRLIPYTTSGNAWPSATLVTISFMPDGTSVNGASSNLFAKFNAKFGSPAVWQNQILRAAQQWAQQTNLNFAVVPDNGAALGSGSYQQGDPGFGDIRIGGYSFGSSCLAQAYLPPPVNNYSIAGDFQFNTGQTFNVGSTYDLFTVALHEFGHSLGLYHSSGTTRTAMSGGYSSAMTGLTVDDVNGIRNIYAAGQVRANDAFDAAASNGASSSATTITSILNNSAEAGVINNLDLTTTTDVDWYKLVVPAGAGSTLKVKVQSKGLSLLAPSVAIYNSALQLESSVSGNNVYGATLTASTTGIVPGETYYIKVSSSDPSAAFRTGRYALVVNAGTGADPAPALPNTKKASGTPASAGGGQAVAIDYEALVNSNDSGAQQTSATSGKSVAVDLAGNYVVTWAGQDGSGWGIYAQRFNKHGARVGGEFRVNSATSGDQVDPSVAMDDLGNFTIVWSSGGDIYARRYTLLGLSLLGQYRVNSTTGGVQSKPAVAMDSLGNSVITWTSGDGSGQGVYARLYTVLGLPLSGEFRVNATTAGDQTDPAVAMNGLTGNFTIAWSSVGQDGSGSDIYARSYSLLGLVRTPEFRVNTTTAGDQARPSVASERLSGNEVIAWQSQQEGNDWDIHAQLYGAGAEGSEFRVNTTTAGAQTEPALAMDAGGNFLVTWTSFGAATGLDVMSQLFSASGDPREAEFGINNTLEGDQQHATPAIGLLGQAIVVWSGATT
jgi:hypothetical protein